MSHYAVVHNRHAAPKLRAPFNLEARLKAGFTVEEINFLTVLG
jgi:uncharacterized ferritin-like protein (DUF455 family)